MCSSVFSTHYLPILFSEFLHGPLAIFPLFTYLLMRGGQPRPYASPGAVPLCFPPTPYSSPASFWVFSQMLCWCPLMCTEWIYKAEECFFLAVWFSDYAEVNVSLENLMPAVLVLSLEGVQKLLKFTAPNALLFSSPS